LIETQSGGGVLEMFYGNNSGQYSRDELEVGIADDGVVEGWLKTQREASLTYADKRRVEYPSIGDQLDYIYHNGLDKWKADMIKPVKERYPKP
jgi:hypothetical protein